jgi:hypothetical protein
VRSPQRARTDFRSAKFAKIRSNILKLSTNSKHWFRPRRHQDMHILLIIIIIIIIIIIMGYAVPYVVWVLCYIQAGRSRFRVPTRSLKFFLDLILSAAPWPRGVLSL